MEPFDLTFILQVIILQIGAQQIGTLEIELRHSSGLPAMFSTHSMSVLSWPLI